MASPARECELVALSLKSNCATNPSCTRRWSDSAAPEYVISKRPSNSAAGFACLRFYVAKPRGGTLKRDRTISV